MVRKIRRLGVIFVFTLLVVALVLWKSGALMKVSTFVSGDNKLPVPQISAGQAILIDGATGKVIYEKDADEKAYPASTTKIMTALLMLETLEKYDSPLNQKVTIPEEAVGTEGSSLYLEKGERIRLEDLLYGLMLCSGNDAAVAVSLIASGDQEEFIKRMNDKAVDLHCKNTHFVNPNGLFDENHYTTVRDMAIIAKAAMENEDFRKIVSETSWEAKREKSDYEHFYNKNKTVRQFKGGSGVKIGYTKASGRTLVASATRNGREVICVVMCAPNWFNDAYTLMEYGFKRLGE
ncbi:MAG: D-alanyl-D-alanine carboxypeptidase family protein [Anaerovoracaceae bacterium]